MLHHADLLTPFCSLDLNPPDVWLSLQNGGEPSGTVRPWPKCAALQGQDHDRWPLWSATVSRMPTAMAQPQWHYAAGCEEHGVRWSFPTTSTCLKSTFWSQRPRPSTPSPVQPWTGGGQCAAEPLCCATNISDAHGHVVPNWGSAAPRPACLLWWGGVCSRWPCRRAPDFTGRDRQSICCIYLFYHYRRSISKCVQKDPLFLQGYTTPCSQLNRNNLTSPEKADGKYKCIFSFTILYTYFPEWRTKT